jgi:hypothetical protein
LRYERLSVFFYQICKWIRIRFDQKSFPTELEFIVEAVGEDLPVVGSGLNVEAGLLVFVKLSD